MRYFFEIVLASALVSYGSVSAQSDEIFDRERRGEERTFRVPKSLRLDETIRAAIIQYEIAFEEHRAVIEELRNRLTNSGREERAGIREEIKNQARAHRETQREFRKSIRKRISELRSLL